MTSSGGGTEQGKKGSQRKPPRRIESDSTDNETLQSIGSKASVLLHPQVTLTCYIPTNCVGAVIGRRGSTIVQIQRHAQQIGNGPVRVSIVGHDEEGSTEQAVPYTYSDLDWSSPHWTPVVIRADPCAALAAAHRLHDIVGELDEVVLDLPLSRNKHASLIGKRGLVLANLSADTQVRIMVPPRELRHDVIQLEGDLDNVKKCLEKVLVLAGDKKKPQRNNTTPTNNGGNSSSDPSEDVGVVTVSILPSQTKIRNIGRKTETIIKKKKVDDEWQLLISGSQPDQVQAAVAMFEKWHEEQKNSPNNPTSEVNGGGGGSGSAGNSGTPSRTMRAGGGRGRGQSRGAAGGNNSNKTPKGKKSQGGRGNIASPAPANEPPSS